MDLSDLDVAPANPEFTILEAHGRRTIAATAALMEHQWPMCFPQPVDDLPRLVRDVYSCVHGIAQKKPIAFLS